MIQIPCEWKENSVDTPVFDAYMDALTDGDDGIHWCLHFQRERVENKKSIISCKIGRHGKIAA